MPPRTAPPPTPGTLETLVRTTEKVVATCPCRLRRPSGRVNVEVAVISHSTGQEESAVLVYAPAADGLPLRILHAMPIRSSFHSALTQIPPSPTTSYFAQSSKPNIEITLSEGRSDVKPIELQVAPGDTVRVQAIMKQIRRAVDSSFPSPVSHSWLVFYPEAPGDVAPEKTDAETMTESLEASFGKLGDSDSEGSDEVDALDVPSQVNGSGKATATTDAVEDKAKGNSVDSESTVNEVVKKAEEDELNATVPEVGSAEQEQAAEDEFPNPFIPNFSRTNFLRKRLFGRQEKWSTTKPLSIRIVTYNVNDRVPPPGSKELSAVVGGGSDDVIAVGVQEADLRSQALLASQGTDRAEAWEQAILNGLGDKKEEYDIVTSVQYVGVLLVVIVRKTLRDHIKMVEESAKGIGLLGFGGNKAGVAVRLKIHDTTMCFVNSHLAAFANQLERRRWDYLTLRTSLTFPLHTDTNPVTEAFYPEDRPLSIDDSELTFWFGDLNYRLDLTDQEVKEFVEKEDWESMLLADQLSYDISEKMSFASFSEPKITFRPTFKYVHGSVTLDPKRAPAYTDRILHRTRGPAITSKEYTSHELLWSDHLPVSSVYSVDVRVVDEAKRSEELVNVQRELDKLDELYRASLAVDTDDLDFGIVKYRRPVEREIILRNTGRVPAQFSFREPGPGKPICKPWFWPFPSTGTVESGKDVKIVVTLDVDDHSSLALTGGEEMNDVLVLQVAGGKDSFVSLRAQMQPTIVGLPLELLPDLPSVIAEVPLAERKSLIFPPVTDDPYKPSKENGPPKSSKPPREVWRLLERLITDGAGVDKLWTSDEATGAMLEVIDALDTGAEKIAGDTKATAQALLHILYALPTPVVPDTLKSECLGARERYAAFSVVEKIPSVNANVLIGLMSVAKLCAGDSAVDDTSVRVLATAVFGEPPAGREGFVRALIEG